MSSYVIGITAFSGVIVYLIEGAVIFDVAVVMFLKAGGTVTDLNREISLVLHYIRWSASWCWRWACSCIPSFSPSTFC